MFFWKIWKKKKPGPPPIKPTPPSPPAPQASPAPASAPAPLVPLGATAHELETTYQSHWRRKDFRSPEWHALGGTLARHPNISPEFLKTLVSPFPKEAAENPALPLILLEQPDFFGTVNPQTLQGWLRDATTPAILIQGLLTHPEAHIATPARYHVAVVGDDWVSWFQMLTTHFRTLPVKKKQEWYLAELALQNRLPAWLRMQLAGSRTGEIRAIAVNHPQMRPLRELMVRASGVSDLSRLGPAASKPVSVAELIWLADGPYWFRVLAARHPDTPHWTLARLINDPDGFLRVRVLRNPATPPDVLRRYAQSDIEAERIAVARNPACPPDVLTLLQKTPSERVQQVLEYRVEACLPGAPRKVKDEKRLPLTATAARRPIDSPFHDPNLTQQQLNELANASNRDIRRLAMRRGGLAKPAWPTRYQWNVSLQRLKISEVLGVMAVQDYGEIRKAAQSMDWETRLVILANPYLTYELLQELAQDGHQWVRAAARTRLTTGAPLEPFGVVELP